MRKPKEDGERAESLPHLWTPRLEDPDHALRYYEYVRV